MAAIFLVCLSIHPYVHPPLPGCLSGPNQAQISPKRPKSTLSDLKSPLSGPKLALSDPKPAFSHWKSTLFTPKSALYSAMHKKRYKFSIQDFYAQKLLKRLFFMRNPKSWKKWSDWHQSQTFCLIWLNSIINWKLGIANWCKISKWLSKLSLIISRFFELTLN